MKTTKTADPALGMIFGQLYSFNESLKLHHWQDTGPESYARHMATDETLGALRGVLDRMVETAISIYGDIGITIPETAVPECLCTAICSAYETAQKARSHFDEPFMQAIIDDYQEALHQLNYRITRLS